MTNSESVWEPNPWEPPFAGTEAEQFVGALNRLRTTFRWKAGGLDAAGLQHQTGASSLTLGGLLKHLALNEDYAFTTKMRGESIGAPWETIYRHDDPDWEFSSAADDSPDELYALWDGAIERSRARLDAALADGGLDQPVHVCSPDGRHASLRRLVFDLIEEYGRHTGHADLLREAVDGLTGEDPPDGWHARLAVRDLWPCRSNRKALVAQASGVHSRSCGYKLSCPQPDLLPQIPSRAVRALHEMRAGRRRRGPRRPAYPQPPDPAWRLPGVRLAPLGSTDPPSGPPAGR